MAFDIVDEEERIFSLLDPSKNEEVRWRVSDKARPGLAMVMEPEQEDIKDPEERVKELEDMSREEQMQALNKERRKSQKILFALSSIVELMEPEKMPRIFEDKIEYLAFCLEDGDVSAIYTFFLSITTSSTTFQGQTRKTE